MSELLRIENVSYRYNEKILALNNVSVTFQKGERVVILGSNGAGKSTFFLCCNGVLHPMSGKIFYNGREISKSKNAFKILGLEIADMIDFDLNNNDRFLIKIKKTKKTSPKYPRNYSDITKNPL